MTKKQKKSSPKEPAQDRLSDTQHCDELSDMKSRLWGLHLAVTGISDDLDTTDGDALLQLTRDVAERMEAVHAAFAEEYDLRFAEKGSA